MLRFAILAHDHPFLHWDLLLECGGICRSWRILADPGVPGPLAAETLPDHRVFYLDYEGPVTGHRGHVSQWDAGRCVWLMAREDMVQVLCFGRRWRGRVTVRRTETGWQVELAEGSRLKMSESPL
jgi:hypothetical protein